MTRALSVVGLVALCLTWVAPAPAQVPDHLKCYKVKDPQAKILYTADLGGLVAEPGCRIKVPAAMACVPATKTNVTPMPPGGGGSGTPNAFGCYKIKCRKATLPPLALNDQFGSRTVTPSTAKLLCAPLAGPSTTTTTIAASTTTITSPLTTTTTTSTSTTTAAPTTTTSSTSTTTLPGCASSSPMCSSGACPGDDVCVFIVNQSTGDIIGCGCAASNECNIGAPFPACGPAPCPVNTHCAVFTTGTGAGCACVPD